MGDQHPGALLAGAAAGAGLFGLSDAMVVVGQSSLVVTSGHQATLLLLDGGFLAVAGALAALPLLAVPALRTMWAGFLWGILLMTVAGLGEWWFTQPPAFIGTESGGQLRGNPILFGVIALGMSGLIAGLMWKVHARGLRAVAVVSVLMALGLRGFSAERALLPLGEPPAGAPNVLLVTFDTSRADHFSAYGASLSQTPRFDQLASEGALIETATSQIPVTGPSHTTILSGQPPWQHGALLNGVPVNGSVAMMAEYLRANGWRTGAFISAYVLDGDLGFSRGFEVYDDDFSWLQGWPDTLPGRFWAAATRRFSPDHVLERRGGRTVDQALTWMEPAAGGARPFFGWVHLFDPHGPYTPPPPWDTAYYEGDPRDPSHTSMQQVGDVAGYLKPALEGITDLDWVLAQYAGEISYTDEQLGRLLDALTSWGIAEQTLVVVVGDHGESLTEHGVWFNHGDDLFAPSTLVPMAIRYPGEIAPGTVVQGPVELTDVARTVYDLLALEPPSTALRDGAGASLGDALQFGTFTARAEARSLTFDRPVNLAERQAGRISRPVYRMVALRRPGQYLYVYRDAPGVDHAFYDVSAGLSGEDSPGPLPGAMGSLEGAAQGLLDVMSAEDLDRSSADPDAEMEARLRALGYIE